MIHDRGVVEALVGVEVEGGEGRKGNVVKELVLQKERKVLGPAIEEVRFT
jgi:hypothetical protein